MKIVEIRWQKIKMNWEETLFVGVLTFFFLFFMSSCPSVLLYFGISFLVFVVYVLFVVLCALLYAIYKIYSFDYFRYLRLGIVC